MAKYMIYTDWNDCIGYRKNPLDREVGEFAYINDKNNPGKGKKVMVYANFEWDTLDLEVVKYVFNKTPLTDKFHEVLNSMIEEIISLNKIGYGQKILRMKEEQRLRRKEEQRRSEARLMRKLNRIAEML